MGENQFDSRREIVWDAEEEVGSLWRTERIYDYYGRIVVMYAMERTTYVLPVKDGKLAASGTRR